MNENYFIIFFLIFLQLSLSIDQSEFNNNDLLEEVINLEPGSSLPTYDDENYFYIPIIHTNDIHGSFYPKKILLPSGKSYSIGGLEYLGKYISIMKKEWKDRFLYFDSGDQFQGGIEGSISKGKVIMDFFNQMGIKYATIGNHEYDYGIEFMKYYMNLSKFNWVLDNVKNTTTNDYINFPNQNKSQIIDIEGYKLGIIGLSTIETVFTTSTDLRDLKYEAYERIIKKESIKLKEQGANAIIVLAHIGLYCRGDINDIKLEYKLRDKSTFQSDCRKTDEAYKLIKNLNTDIIDVFFAGHKHDVTHNWINGIPVMSNDRNGKYAQIIYLPFDRKTKKLINNKIIIEGPLPICEKIFKNKKICDLAVINQNDEKQFGDLVSYKFHGQKIEKENIITDIGEKYQNLFNKYNKDYLTYTFDHFESFKEHENNLGNFICEFLRHISGADISIVNPGSFRTPLYRGNISNATIHSFDPFGNKIVKFYAFGWEVKKMIKNLQQGSKGFYPSSGLKMTVKNFPKKKLLKVKLFDGINEKEIENDKYYSIVSSEFCFPINGQKKGGDDFRKIYEWFKPRNPTYIEVGKDYLSRDLLINYLRNIKELKGNIFYDENDLKMRII